MKNLISTNKGKGNNASVNAPQFNLFVDDNYSRMNRLLTAHNKGFAKVIFADPPYNTKAPQSYEDSMELDEWLHFISSRIHSARNCLTDDGVFVAFINEKYQAYMKLMLDHIFGQQNGLPAVIWEHKKASGSCNTIHNTTEYIFVYAKNIKLVKWGMIEYDEEQLKLHNFVHKDDNFEDAGYFQKQPLEKFDGHIKNIIGSERYYPIIAHDGTEIYPKDGKLWTFSKDLFDFAQFNGFICIEQMKGEWRVFRKNYANIDFHRKCAEQTDNDIFFRNAGIRHGNIIQGLPTSRGTADLKNILGKDWRKDLFKYPKPVDLIKHLLQFVELEDDDLILDIFGGSGTTAQAVAEFNAEQGIKLDCTLITIDEKNIPQNVTIKRINAVNELYDFNFDVIMREGKKGSAMRIQKRRIPANDELSALDYAS